MSALIKASQTYDDVAATWLDLAPHATYFFQLPSWAKAVARSTLSTDTLWLCSAAGPRAADVLRIRQANIKGMRYSIVSNIVSSPVPFIEGIYKDFDPRDLVQEIPGWDMARLKGLRIESSWLRAKGAQVRAEQKGCATVLDLPSDSESWWASAPKNLRKTIRKRRANAEKIGTVEIAVAESPREIQNTFQRFVSLEAQGWKAATGRTLAQRTEERSVLSHFLYEQAHSGGVRIYALKIGNTDAAFQVTVRVGKTLYMLKTSYDESFAAISPGNLLIASIIEAASDDPLISRIDFCARTPWQDHWRMELEPTFEVVMFNRASLRGRLLEFGWRTFGSSRWESRSSQEFAVP